MHVHQRMSNANGEQGLRSAVASSATLLMQSRVLSLPRLLRKMGLTSSKFVAASASASGFHGCREQDVTSDAT